MEHVIRSQPSFENGWGEVRVECVESDASILETLAGDAEIGDFETAAGADQNILWSQISMDDSGCMELLESSQECDHLDSRLTLAEGRVIPEVLHQVSMLREQIGRASCRERV